MFKPQPVSLLVCLLIVFAILPNAAQADFEFLPPQTLSEPGVTSAQPEVAVDSQDRATVVWQAVSPDGQQRLVQLVRLDANGSPGPVVTLAEMPNATYSQWCLCPKLAVDSLDRVTILWQAFDGTDLRLQAIQLDASGVPGPLRTLSESGHDAFGHELAVDTAGRATVAWQLHDSPALIQSVRLPPGEPPESVQTLSPADIDADAPDVAVDLDGRATVAWASAEGLQAVRLDAGGSPESIQTLSPPGEDAGLPRVVIDSEDRATIAWWRFGGVYEAKIVRLSAGGVPGPIRTLSPSGVDVLNPQLAVDPQNRVTVTWEDFVQQVHTVRVGADGVPGPVHPLSSPDRVGGHPQVAALPDGGAVVVWTHPPIVYIPPFEECLDNEFQPQSDVVEAAFINPDGTPGPLRSVSAFGEQSMEARVAVDSRGRPTVVWHSFDGTYFCSDSSTRVQSSTGLQIADVPPSVPVEKPPVSKPVLPGVTHEGATLRLAARAVVRGHQVAIRAVCAGDLTETCEGEFGLFSRTPLSRKRTRARPRRALLSRGSYRLHGGDSRIVKLWLSRFGRTLYAQAGPMTIRATARGQGVESRTVSLVKPRRQFAQPANLSLNRRVEGSLSFGIDPDTDVLMVEWIAAGKASLAEIVTWLELRTAPSS